MMPLSSGGGVQVAIAFLDQLTTNQSDYNKDVDWQAVVPDRLVPMLPERLACDKRLLLLRKKSRVNVLSAARALSHIESDFRADVVFTVFGPAYFRACAPHLVGFALPNLIYERDPILRAAAGPFGPAVDTIKRFLVRRANHFVVETETARCRLATRLNIRSNRISVIANSLNPQLSKYTPQPYSRQGVFKVLIPSAYYRHKNLELIPEIAGRLQASMPRAEFQFQLTLDPASVPMRRIMQTAKSLGVTNRLKTLGQLRLDGLAEAYQCASAVMLPTVREISTAVYPESFYFERPLVTSDLDFARELCGDAALYCNGYDAGEYAATLALLIADRGSGKLTDRLISEGRARLTSTYPTPDEKFEQQIRLLREVAGNI